MGAGTGQVASRLADLVVQCDTDPGNVARLDFAAALARRHGAHLVGLHVIDVMATAALASAGAGDAAGLGILVDRLRADALEDAAKVETAFRAAMERAGIAGEWRLVEDGASAAFTLHARHADLVLLGQEDVESPMQHRQDLLIEQLLFGAGRPVLLAPARGRFTTAGTRALIAWNGSREATRALHDALPLIAGAEAVTLAVIDPDIVGGRTGPQPGADIARHLARHGLAVDVAVLASGGEDEVDVLLRTATERGADLLVMGGYGHARLREMILGGVTRGMLRRMNLPVLMSH
ncbi:MAG: universal stress protein [Acetobacteraceae bacterium]|nr:universal stress protein [Acetobacteraceae bacterium]